MEVVEERRKEHARARGWALSVLLVSSLSEGKEMEGRKEELGHSWSD